MSAVATLERGTTDSSRPGSHVAESGLLAPNGPPKFRDVYDNHFEFVWRYAAFHGVPATALDDVVQEVFIVVHGRIPTFEGRASLRAWIAGVAHNVVRDYIRKRANRPM